MLFVMVKACLSVNIILLFTTFENFVLRLYALINSEKDHLSQ